MYVYVLIIFNKAVKETSFEDFHNKGNVYVKDIINSKFFFRLTLYTRYEISEIIILNSINNAKNT